jgi:hypothetical protein
MLACMGEVRNAYKILVRKPERKRPLRKPRYKSEDNIRMDLKVMGWGVMDCILLDEDGDQWQTLANMVMNLWVP